jgi:hypothetical protein
MFELLGVLGTCQLGAWPLRWSVGILCRRRSKSALSFSGAKGVKKAGQWRPPQLAQYGQRYILGEVIVSWNFQRLGRKNHTCKITCKKPGLGVLTRTKAVPYGL